MRGGIRARHGALRALLNRGCDDLVTAEPWTAELDAAEVDAAELEPDTMELDTMELDTMELDTTYRYLLI